MSQIDYATIPPLVLAALQKHARHEPVGGFVRAVLENDLKAAVNWAAPDSLAALRSILAYVYWELPAASHGTPAKVQAWHDGLDPLATTTRSAA